MIRKLVIALLIMMAVLAAFVGLQIPAKRKYDEARETLGTPLFTLQPIDASSQSFYDEMRSSWEIQIDNHPDPTIALLLPPTGFENSISGILDFYTHEMPSYSFFNQGRNKKEAIIGLAQAVGLTVSVDDRVHYKDGLAFIRIHPGIVDVYQDGSTGVRLQRFLKQEESEQAEDANAEDADK